jgi:hypothetical protein
MVVCESSVRARPNSSMTMLVTVTGISGETGMKSLSEMTQEVRSILSLRMTSPGHVPRKFKVKENMVGEHVHASVPGT